MTLEGADPSRKFPSKKDCLDGNSSWLDAHYDPVASLYSFSNCMGESYGQCRDKDIIFPALEDLNCDGDHLLLIGDLGSGQFDMKLKVYKGTEMNFETPLLDLPTGVCTFFMDTTDPRTPAVAVASGSFVYIYKNFRPYFKFTLPSLELNSTERDLWTQVKECRDQATNRRGAFPLYLLPGLKDKIDPTTLKEALGSMNTEGMDISLTVRSLRFLQLEPSELQPFVNVFKHIPLKRQSIITCLSTLKKSHTEMDAVSCLVVGTENRDLYILDPEAFTVLTKMSLPAVPVFLSVSGLYEVEYQLSVACRDASVYTFKRGGRTPKYKIVLGSQPCGLLQVDKQLVVGCMDNTLSSFSPKGKRQWNIKLPDSITALELLDHQSRGVKAVIVALRNNEIRVYRDKYLVHTLSVDDAVVGMKFGRFGREEASLLLVTQGGSLIVKILKRTANLDIKELVPGPPKAQSVKLNVPKKTKVFVDQTVRERENSILMHNIFQRDLCRLKLETARSFVKAISSSLMPVTTSSTSSLKITAQVQGLGPLFKLVVIVQNTSPTSVATNYYVTFMCDESLYRISSKLIQLPLLVPLLSYDFEALVECLDDMGKTDDIHVYVFKPGNPSPLITAQIKMPVSESVIVI